MVGFMDCGVCGGRHSGDMLCVDLSGSNVASSTVAPDFVFGREPKILTVTSSVHIIIEEGITMDEAARGLIDALRRLGATVILHDDNEPYEFA